MKKFKKIVKAIFPYIKNKYILTTLIFLVWLLFLDNNNLVDRYGYIEEYNQLVRDQEYYLKKIETDSKRMEELRTNKENLEKFSKKYKTKIRN